MEDNGSTVWVQCFQEIILIVVSGDPRAKKNKLTIVIELNTNTENWKQLKLLSLLYWLEHPTVI